tara:strand:- start:229 stop:705 length:477 start_codon:yes stop_codon:yes gene_type:complete
MIVSSQIEINNSKECVLNIIRSPRNLEKIHPFCKENRIETWNEEKSIDYVHYYNGKIYKRKFMKWNNEGYVLEIYEDRKLATISWIINSNDKNSIIEIIARPYMPFKYKLINIIIFNLYVRYLLKTYLDSVVKGLKYYSETNISVRKDQFGKHIWYSG